MAIKVIYKKRHHTKPNFKKIIAISSVASFTAIILFILSHIPNDPDKYGNKRSIFGKLKYASISSLNHTINFFFYKIQNVKSIFKRLYNFTSYNSKKDSNLFNKTCKIHAKCCCEEIKTTKRFPLHEAIIHENEKEVENLIENGADIFEKDSNSFKPIDLAWTAKNRNIKKILIKHGAFTYCAMGSTIAMMSPLRAIQPDLDQKFLKYNKRYNKESLIDKLTAIINDNSTPPYEKQSALYFLIIEHKNFKLELKDDVLKNLIEKIDFNQRFFKSQKFKEIIKHAEKNNLNDSTGTSILNASAKFSKDHTFVLKFFLEEYEKYAYSNNEIQKKNIKNNLNSLLENAKKYNKKLYIKMRNLDYILKDLADKNLLNKINKKNRQLLEPEIVKNIICLIGANNIYSENIYYPLLDDNMKL